MPTVRFHFGDSSFDLDPETVDKASRIAVVCSILSCEGSPSQRA